MNTNVGDSSTAAATFAPAGFFFFFNLNVFFFHSSNPVSVVSSSQGPEDRHSGMVPRERSDPVQALRQRQSDAIAV